MRDAAGVAAMLRRCEMPEVEIGWVLATDDAPTVHMILELHRERLEEELAERRCALLDVEARLTERVPASAAQ